MKNRTIQLIWQTFYCTLALVAIIGSVGFFDMRFTGDFYIYFTNISNYLAAGIMLAELVQTARKRGDSFVTVVPRLRFISSWDCCSPFWCSTFCWPETRRETRH